MLPRAHVGPDNRTWIACVIIAFCAALPVVACTDGTTPDCSSPEAGCGPDLSGQVEAGEAGDAPSYSGQDTGAVDSASPIIDSGDASLDADAARG